MQKILFLFSIIFLLVRCTTSSKKQDRILFVTSNQHTYGNSDINASNHFAEIVLAYDVFVESGYKVDVVSPEGGAIPIGYISTSDPIQKKYLYNADFMNLLKNTYKPDDVSAIKYRAVYYSGGGAAMFGIPENEEIQKISIHIYKNGGIVSAICHGTAGIVNLKTNDGNYLYSGKEVNGFPDLFENKEAEYYKHFPFSIQEIIEKRGGKFTYSKEGWDDYSSVDGRLITGQDPSASASVAKKVIEILQNQNK